MYIDNRKVTDLGDLQKIQSNEIKSVETDLQSGVVYGSDVRAAVRIVTIKPEEGLSASLTVQDNQTMHFNGLGIGRINYPKGKWDVSGDFTAQRGHKTPHDRNDLSFDSNGSAVSVLRQLDNMSKNKTLSYKSTIKFWRSKAEVRMFKQYMTYGGQSYGNPYFAYELDNVFRHNQEYKSVV